MQQKIEILQTILESELGIKNLSNMQFQEQSGKLWLSFKLVAMQIVIDIEKMEVYKEVEIMTTNGKQKALMHNSITDIIQDCIRTEIQSVSNNTLVW